MANQIFHISKAERNESFYSTHSLESSRYKEWALVVLFYVCLHYVDAILFQDASLPPNFQNPRKHDDRKAAIANCAKLDAIAKKYLNLARRCRDVRYDYYDIPPKEFDQLYKDYYIPIRSHLRLNLGLRN